MSLKTSRRTAERIIEKVESGDYDPEIIVHMVQSLVEGRDRRIKHLQGRAKERTFDLSIRTITGSLRNTIECHGPITSEFISSAAKRIYGNCQRVIDENTTNHTTT